MATAIKTDRRVSIPKRTDTAEVKPRPIMIRRPVLLEASLLETLKKDAVIYRELAKV